MNYALVVSNALNKPEKSQYERRPLNFQFNTLFQRKEPRCGYGSVGLRYEIGSIMTTNPPQVLVCNDVDEKSLGEKLQGGIKIFGF